MLAKESSRTNSIALRQNWFSIGSFGNKLNRSPNRLDTRLHSLPQHCEKTDTTEHQLGRSQPTLDQNQKLRLVYQGKKNYWPNMTYPILSTQRNTKEMKMQRITRKYWAKITIRPLLTY